MDLVRRVSRFSGVKLLAYGVMSNHFHVFVYIGHPEWLDDAEIVRRIAALYSDGRFDQVMKKWNELAKRPDSSSFRRYRKSFLRRMWNTSEFMKTLKQHCTMSFNASRDHHGTMWESRYRVRVKDPRSPAYLRTTLGIASREYFTKANLRPLTEAGWSSARIRIIRIRRVRNTHSQRQGASESGEWRRYEIKCLLW